METRNYSSDRHRTEDETGELPFLLTKGRIHNVSLEPDIEGSDEFPKVMAGQSS